MPLNASATPNAYAPGQDVVLRVSPTTASSDPLSGPDVIVMALVFNGDGSTAHGQFLLQDDGQGVDGAAGDGTYAATLATGLLSGDLRVMLHVAQTGFFQSTVPSSFGYELLLIEGDDVVFADGFESGDTSRWSGTNP